MAEKSPEFDDIAADKLTLWSVSIANDDDYDEIPILLDNLTDQDKKLKPTTKLSKVFDVDLPEETIHIIVRRPAPAAELPTLVEFTVTVKGVRYRNNATLEWMAASTATLQWSTDTATATLDEHRNEFTMDETDRIYGYPNNLESAGSAPGLYLTSTDHIRAVGDLLAKLRSTTKAVQLGMSLYVTVFLIHAVGLFTELTLTPNKSISG
ncbi:hypothetical protein CPC16_005165 [Podila verticillata]|nr:hypothetical protein CPC16_005165 [Podila verticillata]